MTEFGELKTVLEPLAKAFFVQSRRPVRLPWKHGKCHFNVIIIAREWDNILMLSCLFFLVLC